MTCRVKVMAPDGSVTQARALLDCAASTSLISERLAQQLRLPRYRSNFTINRVADIDLCPRGTMSSKVAGIQSGRKQIEVETSVLPKVTADLPRLPGSLVTQWKYLSGQEFATPIVELQHRWTSCLGGRFLVRQSSTAGSSVPPEYLPC